MDSAVPFPLLARKFYLSLDSQMENRYNIPCCRFKTGADTIRSGIEEVITSTTGNRVAVMSGTRVRIPPTPPKTGAPAKRVRLFYKNFCRRRVHRLK